MSHIKGILSADYIVSICILTESFAAKLASLDLVEPLNAGVILALEETVELWDPGLPESLLGVKKEDTFTEDFGVQLVASVFLWILGVDVVDVLADCDGLFLLRDFWIAIHFIYKMLRDLICVLTTCLKEMLRHILTK